MGIRIEDSVCIQKESPLVFTTEAVKEVCGCGYYTKERLLIVARLSISRHCVVDAMQDTQLGLWYFDCILERQHSAEH